MMATFTDIVNRTLRSTTYRTKRYVVVKPKYCRDSKGRFVGGLRKGYSYRVPDYSKPISVVKLIAENITRGNSLLAALKARYSAKNQLPAA